MLAIRINFLMGVCTATRHDDPRRSTAEWPPHPDRLFSALVSATAELSAADGIGQIESAYETLEWLCNLGPPHLAVARAHVRSAPDVHMPTNPHEDEVWQKPKQGKPRAPQKSFKLKTLLPVHRKKAALPIPAVIPEDPVMYFIWPDVEPGEHLAVLRKICERVTYLGRSRSLVHAMVADNPPVPTHAPDPSGGMQLRVPRTGRLSYLLGKYDHDGGKPAPSPPRRYSKAEQEPRSEEELKTVFERCWILRPQPRDALLPAVSTIKVTAALRKALIACIEQDQRRQGTEPKVPNIVHGHGRHPHCAYVALPFVHPSQRFADATIKGLAVFIPRDVESDALLALAKGLERLCENGLGIPGIGTWRVEETFTDDPPSITLDPVTWTRSAHIWTTVTPMVFGHFPKPKMGGEARVVLDSLKMIGVESEDVIEIAVDQHSPLQGAPPSWSFKTQRNSGEIKQNPSWIRHVTLRFARPVRGPIVLGRMRYFGLGLMRPIKDWPWQH